MNSYKIKQQQVKLTDQEIKDILIRLGYTISSPRSQISNSSIYFGDSVGINTSSTDHNHIDALKPGDEPSINTHYKSVFKRLLDKNIKNIL